MADIATQADRVALRPPDEVMRLARLGSFHQSRLSFLRVLLRHIASERWHFARSVFAIDAKGVGHAVYTLTRGARTYSLVAFAHDLPAEKRTDRVIAEEWDATFALFDGVPSPEDIARLGKNVPRQEAGRFRQSELVLARANRSVRLFDAVVAALAAGRQPDAATLETTGYLMRTTAVYGNGKFGIADRDVYETREELAGPFQAEMLTVWLIRAFTVDLAEHLARMRAPDTAVRLAPELRRRLGIGNATGLGMAPFLVRHPALIDRWIGAREEALRRVREIKWASLETVATFRRCLAGAVQQVAGWQTEDPVQAPRIPALARDLTLLTQHVTQGGTLDDKITRPWDQLYRWGADRLTLEGQEMLLSLLIEPHGHLVDELFARMALDERPRARIDGRGTPAELSRRIEQHYGWALALPFREARDDARFWYVSEEKLEPRLGERHVEPGSELELPLAVGRDVQRLYRSLQDTGAETVADFLAEQPEFRHAVRRVLHANAQPYAEVRDNLISDDLRAVDLLRCKLSFFGCARFDPRSDKWLRITLYQGAPFPDEIGQGDWDGWIWESGSTAP
jgi:hypothetical protein